MYYEVILNGPFDPSHVNWLRTRSEKCKVCEAGVMYLETADDPAWLQGELKLSDIKADFVPMAKEEFDTVMGFRTQF